MSTYNLLDVEAFLAVGRTGGFTPAARDLGTSKSVVSRRVRRLEDALETELIRRSTRVVILTEEGRLYFNALAELPTRISEAESLLLSRREVPRGMLRISLPSYMGSSHVTDTFVPAFMTAHPEVTIEIRFTDQGPVLAHREFDLAIRTRSKHLKLADSTLRTRALGRLTSALYAAPRYLASHGAPKSMTDLLDHRCLSYPSKVWRFSDASGDGPVIEVNAVMSTGSNEVLKSATASGLGIVYSFETVFRDLLAQGKVVEILPGLTEASGLDLQLIYPAGQHPPLRTRRFIEGMRAEFAKGKDG